MHKSYKKTVTILIACALISVFLCFPVSAAVTDKVSHGNFTFSQPSFRTYVKDWGYSDPGSDVVTQLSVHSNGVTETTFSNINGATFGGGSNNYRCMRGMISFPYSDSDRQFVIRVTPQFIVDGVYSDNFDMSLGSTTYFSNGGITSDPYLDYTAVRDGKSVIFTVDVGNYDDIYFQFSSLCYSNWQVMKYIFDGMSIIGDDGTDDIINNQNNNTNNIINNNNSNTDKIIQNQEQLQENEKHEAQGSGNSAADDVTNVMPNKSEGFMNAMQSFVGAMSTTDTACNISFPGIKVPALEGFFPETELLGETDIDFSQAIGLIPENVLKLIRALTTVGLIVFCFKELYDTISEALTRRQQNE